MRGTSGWARASHFSTASVRAFSELTFQVAIRMTDRVGRNRAGSRHLRSLVGALAASRTMARMPERSTDPDGLIERIRASVLGDDEAVAGPFGIRRVTYADYTASGRALSIIEDYLRHAVLPPSAKP